MSREAPHVCTTPAQASRLEALAAQLPAHGRVTVSLRDGSTRTGVVQVRASVEVFRGPDEQEGLNAELILECADAPHGAWHLWLDQIERVEHLDSGLADEN